MALPSSPRPRSSFQELIGLNTKLGSQPTNDLDAYVVITFFELAQVAATDIGFMGQFILRPALCVAPRMYLTAGFMGATILAFIGCRIMAILPRRAKERERVRLETERKAQRAAASEARGQKFDQAKV
jgi:hypothetical protein